MSIPQECCRRRNTGGRIDWAEEMVEILVVKKQCLNLI